ncbi:tRNA adenosine(34) deaminase TadA [Candidatus Pantoea edessiphila]|uniref:tRNA-specific adenosine deaminase n=1 Tax=Candidatus Pantoea edessiphila TaxID=2044610 RepID=A0A2P5SWG7_9GAMM|nr:tRNA adenosine(34) deaminase TadA [Candidatus Pantoea edessiphila]PPI86672.1 tRNA adenosine(34) deaminase TadA [Candidatus Pantoea edessiphila]
MNQLQDEYWMRYAIDMANIALTAGEVPVGAVLVKHTNIIGKGWNSSISKNDPSAHAEIIAIREGGNTLKNYRLLNTTLYVTLEPCMMCLGAMIHSRLHRLVYGIHDIKTGAVKSVMNISNYSWVNHKIKTTDGILSRECVSLLNTFFTDVRAKKNYN